MVTRTGLHIPGVVGQGTCRVGAWLHVCFCSWSCGKWILVPCMLSYNFFRLFLALEVFGYSDSKISLFFCCNWLLIRHCEVILYVLVTNVHYYKFVNIEVHLPFVRPVNRPVEVLSSLNYGKEKAIILQSITLILFPVQLVYLKPRASILWEIDLTVSWELQLLLLPRLHV